MYTRLMGDTTLGQLLSRVHGAVNASGTELERFVIESSNMIDDVDAFLQMDLIPEGVFVASKRALKKSNILNYASVQPDFVVFERRGKKHHCYLVELKDGDTFDTKKAAGERESLHRFMVAISPHIQFSTSIHFCCFHRENRQQIVDGFKHKITEDEAMTGREFCDLLRIDHKSIVNKRKEDQDKNFSYFVDTLMQNPAVVRSLEARLSRSGGLDGGQDTIGQTTATARPRGIAC